MDTKYINCKKVIEHGLLQEAAQAIKEEKLVVFPTETVYGIGANGLNETAVRKIYEAKGRSMDNPSILHIANLAMLDRIVQDVSDIEQKLMDAFFPGPFTLILNRKPLVPNCVTANLDTVAVRMPNHVIANQLIELAGVPIAAPSANISGKPSGTLVSDIFEELNGKVDYIIDAGPSHIGLESTVVRVIDGVPTILRPGKITKEQILEVAGKVAVDSHIFEKCTPSTKVLSPGMKYKHYAPNTKCILVYSNHNEHMVAKIQELLKEHKKVLVISCTEHIEQYDCDFVLDVGSKEDLEEISRNIFTTLRKVDSYPIDLVIIEGVTKEGIGLAIMNRLLRACEYNYIEC